MVRWGRGGEDSLTGEGWAHRGRVGRDSFTGERWGVTTYQGDVPQDIWPKI